MQFTSELFPLKCKKILIPPNTAFASCIGEQTLNDEQPYSLKGGWVESKKNESELTDIWKNQTLDVRVVNGISYMEQNIHFSSMKNSSLAEVGRMSVNAYARLFKEQTAYSPKKYLLRMRIEKASNLLHHSDLSIKQIASYCGFSDRYYFTRIFTRIMKIPPGLYRKNSVLNHWIYS